MTDAQRHGVIFNRLELGEMPIGQSKTYFCSDSGRRITVIRQSVTIFGLSVKGDLVPNRIIVSCSRDDVNAISCCFLTGKFL